jgi:hypothetical protein
MAARGLQQPSSDLNIPHPADAESALNPTRTIHYEYQFIILFFLILGYNKILYLYNYINHNFTIQQLL